MYKSGFVAIVGHANAGKSSFLNAVLGHKVSIVTHKVQTTRNIVRGIYHEDDLQIIFLDTPGIHKPKDKLQKYMNNQIDLALKDIDVIVYMLDGEFGLMNKEKEIIAELAKYENIPIIAVVNKIDLITQEKASKIVEELAAYKIFEQIIPISVTQKFNYAQVVESIKGYLEEGFPYYDKEYLTDSPESFMISETIREKIIKFTKEEIPYNTSVVITNIEKKKSKIDIYATIYVARNSQKGIMIGKGGKTLQKIGKTAREDIQEMYSIQVNLFNQVKVLKNWNKNEELLDTIGYGEEKE